MSQSHETEEGFALKLDFDKLARTCSQGEPVVPVVVQEADSLEVLILAFASREALEASFRLGRVVLWSTSRQELWDKGATSGDTLALVEVRVNCEQNSLLFLVRRQRGCCHTRDAAGKSRLSCFYRRVAADGSLSFV